MKQRHKHADVIIAWANGEEIEWHDPLNEKWYPIPALGDGLLLWEDRHEYRIKPKILKKEGWVNIQNTSKGPMISSGIFGTEEDAKKYAGLTTVNKIITVRIEWEEEV